MSISCIFLVGWIPCVVSQWFLCFNCFFYLWCLGVFGSVRFSFFLLASISVAGRLPRWMFSDLGASSTCLPELTVFLCVFHVGFMFFPGRIDSLAV